MIKMPLAVKVPIPMKALPPTRALPTSVNTVRNNFIPPLPAPRRIEHPSSSKPINNPDDGYVTPDSGTETDDDHPPPPPTAPYPKSGRNLPGPLEKEWKEKEKEADKNIKKESGAG